MYDVPVYLLNDAILLDKISGFLEIKPFVGGVDVIYCYFPMMDT